MAAPLTVRLDPELQKKLDGLSKKLGVSKSDIIRDALKRQIALLTFERHRKLAMPFAEARGILTDEDVFREVS